MLNMMNILNDIELKLKRYANTEQTELEEK